MNHVAVFVAVSVAVSVAELETGVDMLQQVVDYKHIDCKTPVVQLRMRNYKSRFINNIRPIKQNIDINNPRSPLLLSHTSHLCFNV